MRSISRRATTLVAAGMLTTLMATSAIAAETTQSVNPGSLTASAANLTLSAIDYSHVDTTSTGTLALSVDDSTGTGDGWKVSVQSSAFVYSGTNAGTNIPANKFALTSAAAPLVSSGQGIDAIGGPKVVTTSGTLDVARTVIEAEVGFGQGAYTQDLGVALTVPGQSRAGTYTGTVTITATAGPAV